MYTKKNPNILTVHMYIDKKSSLAKHTVGLTDAVPISGKLSFPEISGSFLIAFTHHTYELLSSRFEICTYRLIYVNSLHCFIASSMIVWQMKAIVELPEVLGNDSLPEINENLH